MPPSTLSKAGNHLPTLARRRFVFPWDVACAALPGACCWLAVEWRRSRKLGLGVTLVDGGGREAFEVVAVGFAAGAAEGAPQAPGADVGFGVAGFDFDLGNGMFCSIADVCSKGKKRKMAKALSVFSYPSTPPAQNHPTRQGEGHGEIYNQPLYSRRS